MNEAAIAVRRFGLGVRPSEGFPREPKSWLRQQFDVYDPNPSEWRDLPDRREIADRIVSFKTTLGAIGSGKSNMAGDSVRLATQARDTFRAFGNETMRQFATARIRTATASPAPMIERLVHFWANHFAVSTDKQLALPMAGLMEQEAIRPHVLGRFEDMLVAVESHPAMQIYLDQGSSLGPSSVIGARARTAGRSPGLNENLGREILELHTMGVRSGYTQADVTEFAKALTGWTIAGLFPGLPTIVMQNGEAGAGEFVFLPRMHEPGTRTILGKTWPEGGDEQARGILSDLAKNSATARHIATKLARHFIADTPTESLVARLEAAWLESGGHLPDVYRALIDASESWRAAPQKFLTPWEWSIACLRALNAEPDRAMADRIVNILGMMAQPLWRPGSPAGFGDMAADWLGPDALVRRLRAAQILAKGVGFEADPREIAAAVLGSDLTSHTASAIAAAQFVPQGLALLFASPEMLRR